MTVMHREAPSDTLSPEECMSSLCELFGAAAYYAQRFEAALKDLLQVDPRLVDNVATTEAFEALLEKKTMGQLLKRIRQVVTIKSNWPDGLLDYALERRFEFHPLIHVSLKNLRNSVLPLRQH